MRIIWQARIFPSKQYDTMFVKVCLDLEKL